MRHPSQAKNKKVPKVELALPSFCTNNTIFNLEVTLKLRHPLCYYHLQFFFPTKTAENEGPQMIIFGFLMDLIC